MKLRVMLLVLAIGIAAPARALDIEVSVEGVTGELESNVRAHLSLLRYADFASLRETNVRSLHARAPKEIRAALTPFGYYSPKIESSLTQQEDAWIANYKIDPGAPVLVTEVRLNVSGPGADDPALLAIRENPGIVVGQILRHSEYERAKRRLRENALQNGYRDARFTENRLEVDPAQLSARAVLAFDTGTRYEFGEIQFEQDILRDALLRRYLAFRPGDPYNARKLVDLQYALYDSEYFATVEVEPQPAVDYRIPIVVRGTPRARRKYGFGIGYGTDTDVRVSANYQNRRFNRRGHRLSFDTKLSTPKQQVSAQYITPLERPITDRLAYTARYVQEELGGTDSTKAETAAIQTRQLGTWQRRLYLRYSRELTAIGDESNRSSLLTPGMTWTRVRGNDPTHPTRGTYISLDLHGASADVASDVSLLQARIDARYIHPFFAQDRLLMRASVGTSLLNEFDALPASERFFAGGDQSVRGFALNDLGPRDANGNVIGGKHLLVGSIEYEHRVVGPWAVAVFFDGGNAFDQFGDSLEYSAGIGARWLSPIGMVRVDLARPISGGDGGIRVHLSIGPEL